jgi:hypothetical protein
MAFDSGQARRVGISGHQGLAPEVLTYITREIKNRLAAISQLIGISSLAEGADQRFAECVLALGGSLEVIVPATNYRSTFADAATRKQYEHLLRLATDVITLDFPAPSEEAFLAAGKAIVDSCDVLFAVWDGLPARGLGGTADIVEYARQLCRETVVIWPPGVLRQPMNGADRS